MLVAGLILLTQCIIGNPARVGAMPDVFGGTFVPATTLLGDTGCAATSGGPIKCSSIRSSDTLASDLGPLAGQTLIDFSADSRTACAITSTYVAYCWGHNSYAAVGDNTTTDRAVPTPVYTGGALFGVNLKKIAANAYGACAVSTTGRLYCWGETHGYGIYDRFFTGESSSVHLIPPKAVSDAQLASITWADVEVLSNDYICAVSITRDFKCFGGGISTYTTSAIPSNESIISMSATQEYNGLHSCVLSNLGKVYCNGAYYFQPAVASSSSSVFAQVTLSATAVSVRVADGIACAVLSNGGVSCWGYGMRRSTGLGLSGYPVVTLLPSGSNAAEASALMSYGNYPLVVVRKTTGQLLRFEFSSDSVGAPVPIGVDTSLHTPRVSVDNVSYTKPGTYSSCGATSYQVCVTIEGSFDVLSYTSANYAIYSDQSATFLEGSGTSQYLYGDVSLGVLNGLSDHWVILTIPGPYGVTTTSPIYIARQYTSSSSFYSPSSSSANYTSYPVQLKMTLKRFSRSSLKSIIRIKSTGKQTWSVSRGCSIRSGYLVTGNARYCSIKLKVAATKRYRATTDWYTVYLR